MSRRKHSPTPLADISDMAQMQRRLALAWAHMPPMGTVVVGRRQRNQANRIARRLDLATREASDAGRFLVRGHAGLATVCLESAGKWLRKAEVEIERREANHG